MSLKRTYSYWGVLITFCQFQEGTKTPKMDGILWKARKKKVDKKMM